MLFLLPELFWLLILNWDIKRIFWLVVYDSRQNKSCELNIEWLQGSFQYFFTNTKHTTAESVFSSYRYWTYQAYNAATKGLQIPSSQMSYAQMISALW